MKSYTYCERHTGISKYLYRSTWQPRRTPTTYHLFDMQGLRKLLKRPFSAILYSKKKKINSFLGRENSKMMKKGLLSMTA